jgi:uncharacterized membrane-anchored protein YhcB (DUF1043 family)
MPLSAAAAGWKIGEWALKLWPLWAGIILVISGAIWLNVHDARVAREARAEVEARLSTCNEQKRQAAMAVDESRKALGQLQQGYADQAELMAELAKREASAKTRGDKAVAQLAAKEKVLRAEIDRLKVAAEAPSTSPQLSCEEADNILRDLAVRRAATPTGGGG